jgi:hypothetical protein
MSNEASVTSNLGKAISELRTACSEAVTGEAARANMSRGEAGALLDLLTDLAFQHKDSSKFERARESLATELRRE